MRTWRYALAVLLPLFVWFVAHIATGEMRAELQALAKEAMAAFDKGDFSRLLDPGSAMLSDLLDLLDVALCVLSIAASGWLAHADGSPRHLVNMMTIAFCASMVGRAFWPIHYSQSLFSALMASLVGAALALALWMIRKRRIQSHTV